MKATSSGRYWQLIDAFSNDDQFLTSVGTEGTGSLQFRSPGDIAFNILTVALMTNRIKVGHRNGGHMVMSWSADGCEES